MTNTFLITVLLCVTHLVVSSAAPSYWESNRWDFKNNVAKPIMMPNTGYQNAMYYNWKEEAEIQAGRLTAFKMKNILDTGVGWVAVTYLIWRDPTGQLLVFDSQSGIHAERAFTNYLDTNGITPDRVNSFWLSNSPCSDCASELINFFTPTGPASQKIYVGNIYKGGRSINIQQTNREGLERLYEFGFGFDNWDWQLFCNFLINIQFDPTVVEVIQNYISANPPFNNAAYRARDQQTVTCLREVARGCYGQCLFGNRHQYPTC